MSPDELNHHLRTVIVAPMTMGGQVYPWRVECRFQGRAGFVALELRTVDGERLVKRLGRLSAATTNEVLETLQNVCGLAMQADRRIGSIGFEVRP